MEIIMRDCPEVIRLYGVCGTPNFMGDFIEMLKE